MTSKPEIAKEQPNTWTQGGQAKSSDAAAMAEHIRHFGTSAKGITESFDQLAKRHTERKSGLGWKEAWMFRLEMLGHETRLPRGFKMVPMRVINYGQGKAV